MKKDLGERILDMLVEEINKQEDEDKQELLADIYQKAGHIVFDEDEKSRLLRSINGEPTNGKNTKPRK